MDILSHARRRAFSLWLRTGRLPSWARIRATETKYNPWHDPDDGRFTHAGTGRYFGRGGSRSADARMSDKPRKPYGGYGGGGRGFNGGGAEGSWDEPRPAAGRGFEGGGAEGSWGEPSPSSARGRNAGPEGQAAVQPQAGTRARRSRSAIDDPRNWREVVANGYHYWIDSMDRTRRVTGSIVENRAQGRSPSNQADAGRPDRRGDDHGGHFIARRFNGPTAKFNHFAQNASFNRRQYSRLENQWSRSVRAGQTVEVKIEPVYEGSSQRPSKINVWFWTDGHPDSLQFPNEYMERTNGRR